MKPSARSMRKMGWLGGLPNLFPFILAAVSVTALAAANPERGVQVVDVGRPLGVAFCVTAIAWAATAGIVRDRTQHALITAIITLPLLTSGYAFSGLRSSNLGVGTRAGLEVGAVIIFIIIGTLGVCHCLRRDSRMASRFLNLFSVTMLIFTLPQVGRMMLRGGDLPTEVTEFEKLVGTDAPRPDIYFVLLDSYTGFESLRSNYGLDNSSFRDALASRGFVFPDRPRSNYTRTFLSVGSMLNREYMHDIVEAAAPEYTDLSSAYEQLELNRTIQDLRSVGYQFAYVGSRYTVLRRNRLADIQFRSHDWTEFEQLWYNMSILPAAVGSACILIRCREPVPGAETAEATQARLSYLNDLAKLPGPKFVYAHWLLPHGPYRFDADCESREPRWIYGGNRIEEDSVETRFYLDQLECTSQKVLEFVDAVRNSLQSDPVIILQSDHGHGRLGPVFPTLSAAAPDQVKERFDIFAAYAGPGHIADSLAAYRTPVNLFRTLFRVLWGVDEQPLPDLFFWSGPDRWLALEPVDAELLWAPE